MSGTDAILKALAQGPMRPGEVAEATGAVASPKRCYYGLPE